MTVLSDLYGEISSYTTYDSSDFVAEFPHFVKTSEQRIWDFIQLPSFRRAQLGNVTSGNAYLSLPEDFLAPASLAVILTSGEYVYLLNKDVSYMREVFPNPSTLGQPFAYALFDANADTTNILMGPTPDQSYNCQLDYFYRPTSLVDSPTGTWLSEHAYDQLLYGTLSEAAMWMKKSAGIDGMGDDYEKRFLVGLQTLKQLGEARDRKDTYRGGELRSPENP